MFPNEAEVADHRPETVPAGERRGADNEAGKVAIGLDLGVYGLRELDEIILVKRGLRSHQQDGMRGIQFVFDHVAMIPVPASADIEAKVSNVTEDGDLIGSFAVVSRYPSI
jgi:hypothetical protein